MSSSVPPGRRDLNGRVVPVGRLDRLRARLGARGTAGPLTLSDAVVVVASSTDDAAASSTVLEASSWRPEDEVVLSHVLEVPAERADDAIAVAALDGYDHVDDDRWGAREEASSDGRVVLTVARVQLLDAMHLSQERSRMASLGSRHGGTVRRWSVLQRPAG